VVFSASATCPFRVLRPDVRLGTQPATATRNARPVVLTPMQSQSNTSSIASP
jgi:hypothetical protein